jgi:hypothetical protein
MDPKIWAVWHQLVKAKEKMTDWDFAQGYRMLGEALDDLAELGYKPEEKESAE